MFRAAKRVGILGARAENHTGPTSPARRGPVGQRPTRDPRAVKFARWARRNVGRTREAHTSHSGAVELVRDADSRSTDDFELMGAEPRG